MDIRKQLDEFKRIVKAPPIENPHNTPLDAPNDEMNDAEIERLFEKIIDKEIMRTHKRRAQYAHIELKDLKMSPDFAGKKAKQFYGDKGYSKIYIDSGRNMLIIELHDDRMTTL